MISTGDHNSIQIRRRREVVFLILSGIFLGTLVMLNILGVSRFIDLSDWVGIPEGSSISFTLAIGVLPYPITFLCTDFIAEIYGRKRANRVVWVGFILNAWVLLILWFGGSLNAPDLNEFGKLDPYLESGEIVIPHDYSFYTIRSLAFGATFASMIAYMTAQFVDVHVFHYLKRKTKGKMLWLRNNGSTLTSQLVDSVSVILITYFFADGIPLESSKPVFTQLIAFILSAYLFKVVAALIDTVPFYFGTKWLRNYLQVEDEIDY